MTATLAKRKPQPKKQPKKIVAISSDEFLSMFPPDMVARASARAQVLIAEHLTLQELRKAHELTQIQMAALLGIEQGQVSRIEQRADMLISTLASYVQAMGGSLNLVVKFPNHATVTIASLADVFDIEPVKRKSKTRRKP